MGWLYGRRRRRAGGGETVVLLHTFTAANSDTEIPAADTGQLTEVLGSTVWGIVSNQAKYVSGSTDNNRYVVWDAEIADGSLSVTFEAIVLASGNRLAFRCSDIDNLFIVAAEATPRYALYRREAGTYNEIGEWLGEPVNGDVIRVRLNGDAIAVDINGTQRITASDSFNETETKHGLGVFLGDSDCRFDTLTMTV